MLRVAPCIPADWPGYRMSYRFGESVYQIRVRQVDAGQPQGLSVDGEAQPGLAFALVDDRAVHVVEVWVARQA